VGAVFGRTPIRVLLESAEPAADHARLQLHEADRAEQDAPPPSPAGLASGEAAGVGSTIVTSFRVFPFLPPRAQWVARITEFEWNHYFEDVQDKGPFKSWRHRHEFREEARGGIAGTLVRDVIDYEVGFGFVGAIADAIFVRRQMESTFAQRQESLPKLLA
jgi:ligand-binding SRPBCC domain-containing protein